MPSVGTMFARGAYAKGRRVSVDVAVDNGDTRITAMFDRSDIGAIASGRRIASVWIEVKYGPQWLRIGGFETHGGVIEDVDAGGAPLTYSSCTFMLRERASQIRRARVVWESDDDVTAEVLLVTEVTAEVEPRDGRPPNSVAVDTVNVGSGSGVSSVSIASFVVAGNSDRMLMATYFANSSNGSATGTVTGVTWNTSENFTQITGAATSLGTDKLDGWYLLAPTATTATATMSLSNSNNRAVFGLLSLYNVNQATPLGTVRTGSGTTGTTFWIGCEGDADGLSVGWFGNHYAGTGQTVASRNGTPAYIAVGTAISNGGAGALTPTGAPAGRLYGDIEFCSIATENNETISCSGTGWTKLGSTVQQDSTWQEEVWYRLYDGSNVDPAFSWTSGVGCSARRWLMRDLNMTDLEGFHATNSGSGSTHSTTGQNTTANLSRVMYVDHAEANTALGLPSGWTENFDAGSATGPYRLVVGGKDVATSGTGSGNISVTGANASWVQRQIELLAAVAQTHQVEVEAISDGASGAVATEPGAAYNTFGFTADAGPDNWIIAAIGVKPAAGGGGTAVPVFYRHLQEQGIA